MLSAVDVHMLVLVPGIQATPLMFVLLEMIMRSHHDDVAQMQGLHLMSLLTQPGPCTGLAAAAGGGRAAARAPAEARAAPGAGATARAAAGARLAGAGLIHGGPVTPHASPGVASPEGAAIPWASLLPLLGALITSSKSVWLPNWGEETFRLVVSKQLQVTAQGLKLANGCLQQRMQLSGAQAATQAGRKSSSSSGDGWQPSEPSALQHLEALVWAAMYAAHQAYLPLTAIEQLMTSRVAASGYWEQMVAALPAAAPRGLAVSEVLAAFMKEPKSEAEQEGRTKEAAAAMGVAGDDVMRAEGSAGAGRVVLEELATRTSNYAEASSDPAALKAAAAGAFGHKQQAGGSGGKAEEGFHGPAMAVLGVLRRFGIVGLYALTDHMESAAPLHFDSNVISHASLACFSAVSAPSAACSITGALIGVASALRAVCASGPRLFSKSYSTLSEKLFTGSVAYRQRAIARVLACHEVAFCCNNTACSKLQGFTELQLPVREGGRHTGVCGGCKAACYCSKRCQKQAWPAHRSGCGCQ